jgi:hypothetical protein
MVRFRVRLGSIGCKIGGVEEGIARLDKTRQDKKDKVWRNCKTRQDKTG